MLSSARPIFLLTLFISIFLILQLAISAPISSPQPPNPAIISRPSTTSSGSRGSRSDSVSTKTKEFVVRLRKFICPKEDECDSDFDTPEVEAFFEDASEKQAKVDTRIKKKPNPDLPQEPPNCYVETCDKQSKHCLKMAGWGDLPRAKTCCPKEMKKADRKGDCCMELHPDGICVLES